MRPRVVFLQPSRAPYRIALLRELADEFSFKLVYVAGGQDPGRVWRTTDPDHLFETVDAPFRKFRLFGKEISFSRRAALDCTRSADLLITCTNVLDFPTYFLASLVARFRGIPVLCMVTVTGDYKVSRGSGIASRLLNGGARALLRILVWQARGTICYSRAGVEFGSSLGRPAVSSSQFYPLAEEYGDLDEHVIAGRLEARSAAPRLTACIIGYLSPRKGVLELIDMLRALGLTDRMTVKVAGPLDAGSSYGQALLARTGDDVEFLGSVDGEEKIALLKSADIMFFPTTHDSWGFVVNEAMYNGVPVVATNKSQAALDLIDDGVNGWIYEGPDDLARIIAAVADRKTLGAASIKAHRQVSGFNRACLQAWRGAILGALKEAVHA